MSYNTIKVKKYSDVIEEFEAGGTIYPGMLVKLNSDNEVIAHDSAGARALMMVALENELEGQDIDTAYAEGDPVQVWVPYRGDNAYMVLADGQNIAIGDMLESAGNGYLRKLNTGYVIGVALEALDLSGSSGEESSGALGYNKRILVQVY